MEMQEIVGEERELIEDIYIRCETGEKGNNRTELKRKEKKIRSYS